MDYVGLFGILCGTHLIDDQIINAIIRYNQYVVCFLSAIYASPYSVYLADL